MENEDIFDVPHIEPHDVKKSVFMPEGLVSRIVEKIE